MSIATIVVVMLVPMSSWIPWWPRVWSDDIQCKRFFLEKVKDFHRCTRRTTRAVHTPVAPKRLSGNKIVDAADLLDSGCI
jgi:hypothetical protein